MAVGSSHSALSIQTPSHTGPRTHVEARGASGEAGNTTRIVSGILKVSVPCIRCTRSSLVRMPWAVPFYEQIISLCPDSSARAEQWIGAESSGRLSVESRQVNRVHVALDLCVLERHLFSAGAPGGTPHY